MRRASNSIFPGADVGITAHLYNDCQEPVLQAFAFFVMKKVELKYFGSIISSVSLSCWQSLGLPQPATPSAAQSRASFNQRERDPKPIDSVFVKGDRLSFKGSEVIKQKKKVKDSYTNRFADVSYAVLMREGRVLAKFDAIDYEIPNTIDFGLFPFLGGKTKQLAVSQTEWRGGQHWVVDLSPAFRVIYDSTYWGVGGEELQILDIDNDGTYEIIQYERDFYGFENFTSMETPLPTIVFKFDRQERKYLPANRRFQNYVLKGINERIRSLDPNAKSFYLSRRLDIALDYIFAGKEQEAWSFFDKEYRRPDKKEMKTKIRAVLKKQPVYRFIYGAKSR